MKGTLFLNMHSSTHSIVLRSWTTPALPFQEVLGTGGATLPTP